jgi:hypothetical protein
MIGLVEKNVGQLEHLWTKSERRRWVLERVIGKLELLLWQRSHEDHGARDHHWRQSWEAVYEKRKMSALGMVKGAGGGVANSAERSFRPIAYLPTFPSTISPYGLDLGLLNEW